MHEQSPYVGAGPALAGVASQPHIQTMPHRNLTEFEADALAKLPARTIDGDHYSLSPRVQALRAILNKLHPEPVREPPPPKVYV